ncbi:MAG: NADPH-dependent oxidoreductase [Bacteroidales bacterium]|jgi:nitroreductase|nr:NADPH-dependent oxidoreductase [Bacteroidales bacterium]
MIKEIFEHRSIRKYKNEPIPDNVMTSILNAACRASNTGNMQVYSIIVTTDNEIKKALAPTHFNQSMVTQAPAILTFCADFNRFNKWCKMRNAEPGYDNFLSFLTAAIDAVIAAQNACLEAENHGLGICYLGTAIYNPDKIIEILDLPKGVVPITAVTMGYPDENPELTDRLPREAVVHYEKYKDFSESDINRIYAEKEASEESKKFIKENNKDTLAQVFTDVRYPKVNNEHFSKVLFDVLKKQGYME